MKTPKNLNEARELYKIVWRKAKRESSGRCALAAESLLLLEKCGQLINDPQARKAHTQRRAGTLEDQFITLYFV